MNDYDRIKRAFADLARAVFPNFDAVKLWAGKFVRQSGQAGDLQADEGAIVGNGWSNAPFRYPFPGLTFTVDTTKGARAVVAMLSGDPQNPIILAWEGSGLSTWDLAAGAEISLAAPAVNLGQKNATDAVVKGTTYRNAEDTLLQALQTVLVAAGTFATAVGVATPAVSGAAATFNAAIATFSSALSAFTGAEASYLSTIVKTS